jgi:hypothetical protein
MLIPLVWAVPITVSVFGGILYWANRNARLRNGDTAYVPSAQLQLAVAGGIPLKIDSLAGLGGLVKVEMVMLGPSTHLAGGVKTATGTAGKEVGVSILLRFPVSAVVTIERAGQKFANPEKK